MDATAAYYCARRPGVWTTANGCPHPVCVPHIFLFPDLIDVYMYPHNIVYTQTHVRKLIFRIHYGIILMFMVSAPMNPRDMQLFHNL